MYFLASDAGVSDDCLSSARVWMIDHFWANTNARHHYAYLGERAAVEKMFGAVDSEQFIKLLTALRAPTTAPFVGLLAAAKLRVVGAALSQGEYALATKVFEGAREMLRPCGFVYQSTEVASEGSSVLPVGLAAAALWLAVR